MHRSIIFLSVLLACFYQVGLSQTTGKPRQDILIDGSGGGAGITFEDDEDLAGGSGSGSGSGSGEMLETVATYIITINISSQVFTPELNDHTSQLFRLTAARIRGDLEDLFDNLSGEQKVTILSFRQGSLMTTFELTDSSNSPPEEPMKVLVDTLKKGRLGADKVSMTGFVFEPQENAASPGRMTPTTTTASYPTTITTTTPFKPLTQCQRMRETHKRLSSFKFLPRCDHNGDFDALQCNKHMGTDDCWCSDFEGREIPGTRMEAPGCDNGDNMSRCLHQLVNHVRSRLVGTFRPRCAEDGLYERVQCEGSLCFCVDEETGKSEDDTQVHRPAVPDCGGAKSPCLQQLSKVTNSGLLGAFRPHCTEDGLYERVQCQGSVCFCVEEETGKPVEGSQVPRQVVPNCDEEPMEKEVTNKPMINVEKTTTEKDPEIVFPGIDSNEGTITLEGGDSSNKDDKTDTGVNVHIHKYDDKDVKPGLGDTDTKDTDDSSENDTGDDSSDELDKSGHTEERSRVPENQILTQPGLLGGIIGGAVVLLLGIVLLIMFIVYRMRKKDEGSYPLDEPRKPPNYSYVRAPEKEYYA